jgi:CRP-like cAMP-binding protein
MGRRAQRVLESSPFFEEFAEGDIAHLATFAKYLTYEAGQEIFAEDELAERFYVLVSGTVDLSFGGPWQADAKIDTSAYRHSLRLSAWLSAMVEPYAYRATATARERTRLLALDRDLLQQYARDNPQFGMALMRANHRAGG